MKITSACTYALNIPFRESFRHNLSERDHSDSIVVKVTTDSGVSGYGEAVPRSYVTGETRGTAVDHIRKVLLPRIMGVDFQRTDPECLPSSIDRLLRAPFADGTVVWNASRAAVELAVMDCLLRSRGLCVSRALPPVRQTVMYSGVVGACSAARTEAIAGQCVVAGLRHIKMKISADSGVERIATVRSIVGPSVSIRLDANGAFDLQSATHFLRAAAPYGIDCIEQPMPRGDPRKLAALRAAIPIPVMVDESIVTMRDAAALIAAEAADFFNLRVSKCGGIHNTLAIAERATSAGIGVQLGCHVGETAILSAAGRCLAAHLPDVRFVEGSYSTRLLVEDIAAEDIPFGSGGRAPVFTRPGFGITVQEALLHKYADDTTVTRQE